eukprot:1152462-Pelagomonas_calceolata.AAC.6
MKTIQACVAMHSIAQKVCEGSVAQVVPSSNYTTSRCQNSALSYGSGVLHCPLLNVKVFGAVLCHQRKTLYGCPVLQVSLDLQQPRKSTFLQARENTKIYTPETSQYYVH